MFWQCELCVALYVLLHSCFLELLEFYVISNDKFASFRELFILAGKGKSGS